MLGSDLPFQRTVALACSRKLCALPSEVEGKLNEYWGESMSTFYCGVVLGRVL